MGSTELGNEDCRLGVSDWPIGTGVEERQTPKCRKASSEWRRSIKQTLRGVTCKFEEFEKFICNKTQRKKSIRATQRKELRKYSFAISSFAIDLSAFLRLLLSLLFMSPPIIRLLPLLFFYAVSVSSNRCLAAAVAATLFSRSDIPFLWDLVQQCPRSIEFHYPSEVDGYSLDRELTHGKSNNYYSIMFYASWCPFSNNARPAFNALSSMFPQIKHMLVEESNTMPSILSRYGIHSFPAILLSNKTAVIRYRGTKDIDSLIKFYKENTGFHPIAYLVVDQPANTGSARSQMYKIRSLAELLSKEPFLVLGIIFIFLKMFLSILPIIFSQIKSLWISHAWHWSLHVLSELSQLLVRMLHVIDFKKLCIKLKLGCKTRNLRKGANNARAWASTLTSVSLGESSSSRLVPSDS
ncbi:5'-adenylylsulfate reductase-like 5 [Canna indica]|uniref:5'-adenylylsulfate reductase-like 5 n=1 Tax=Canna indica TaxID=4628 RepID=A0AAQ3KH39_9LILI|nr:5'-adenylylsulfate reductase-like 5 [Canna indica]